MEELLRLRSVLGRSTAAYLETGLVSQEARASLMDRLTLSDSLSQGPEFSPKRKTQFTAAIHGCVCAHTRSSPLEVPLMWHSKQSKRKIPDWIDTSSELPAELHSWPSTSRRQAPPGIVNWFTSLLIVSNENLINPKRISSNCTLTQITMLIVAIA